MDKTFLDFHADDFAVSLSSGRDIIRLGEKGAVDSISIIPNMSSFDSSVSLFKTFPPEIKRSIHLNFMEGKSCLKKDLVPDLVDENFCFKVSWGSLLLVVTQHECTHRELVSEVGGRATLKIRELMLCVIA